MNVSKRGNYIEFNGVFSIRIDNVMLVEVSNYSVDITPAKGAKINFHNYHKDGDHDSLKAETLRSYNQIMDILNEHKS